MYYMTEYEMHPSCIINMDETAAKLLGWGSVAGATPIGAVDKRNLTISTVATMTGTIVAAAHLGMVLCARMLHTLWCCVLRVP